MERDLVVAWKELKGWEQKLTSPGRWFEGWTPELIDTSDGWTLEVWIPVNGQMIPYRPTMDKDATVEELMTQVKDIAAFLRIHKGTTQRRENK
jgi:hypothetical protein